MKYAIKVFYLGFNYHGYAVQPNVRTVEGEIICALLERGYITGKREAQLECASRTDKGVSALSQVISFKTDKRLILMEINALLPRDIVMWAWALVSENFSARRSAKLRHYVYVAPFEGEDISLMKKASQFFIGVHDFSALGVEGNPVRRIYAVSIRSSGSAVLMSFIGKSFARKMIMKMVGLLKMVGKGKLSPEDVKDIIHKKKKLDIPTPPSEGLILFDVVYPNITFRIENKALEKVLSLVSQLYVSYFIRTSVASIGRFFFTTLLPNFAANF